MFASRALRTAAVRGLATSVNVKSRKVAVIGAAGGIGQPLSLLLKLDPLVGELALYDVAPVTPGVAADLGHISTNTKMLGGFTGDAGLVQAVQGADVVVVPAGVPRKPGMTRDDLFNINAGIVANIAKVVATTAPSASLCVISNPVNSTVPIAAEIMKRVGSYNPKKLFGVTTLDVVRANTFLSQFLKKDVRDLSVPVIGGHAGVTIMPLLSHLAGAKFTEEEYSRLVHRIQFGGDEVVQAKAGGGSATLSMAYAAVLFVDSVLRGLNGEVNQTYSYIQNDVVKPLPFFSLPVSLGPNGVEKIHEMPKLNEAEQAMLQKAIPELDASIKKGIEFAKNFKL